MSACFSVKSPGSGVCRVCCTGVEAHHKICRNCREVSGQLGQLLEPITPISLLIKESQLYRALRDYKSGRTAAAAVHAHRLAELIAPFLQLHLGCVAASGIDTLLVVPSLGGRRPPPHPLMGVLGMVGSLRPIDDCLLARSTEIDHGQAAWDAVQCAADLDGKQVVLFDDIYTTGCHLQSAVCAVRAAGAAAVHPVVIGRYLRGDWAPSARLLAWARTNRWDPGRCIHCANRN